MITFTLCILALFLGYFFYGKIVERIFAPDDRPTPAVAQADGIDYVAMPYWKIFMIQFLNIAGTGPIFGAIMGAKFGPSAYLWIVFGCIFAGAVHDYFSGMLSMRHDGCDLPNIIRQYLGSKVAGVLMVFTVLLLVLLGIVFVYSPAEILGTMVGSKVMWMVFIFIYYVVATMLPIDKIIGRIYPVFSFSLLFMALALTTVLFIKMPALPELWDGLGNMGKATHPDTFTSDIFPALFITIACGAISGFHGTQSPLMARCLMSERKGRPIFYGAMITEGVVALVWATVSMWFFYDSPQPGYAQIEAAEAGYATSAPMVVRLVCSDWLGVVGGILAVLGVVAAPITSGDTAFRSARLIIAQALKLSQRTIVNRFYICIPLFAVSFMVLLWQISNPDGFNVIWQYFGWANQTLSVFTLWTITVYLALHKKPFVITLVPAVFMTTVCTSFLVVSKNAFGLPVEVGYVMGAAAAVVSLILFFCWKRKAAAK